MGGGGIKLGIPRPCICERNDPFNSALANLTILEADQTEVLLEVIFSENPRGITRAPSNLYPILSPLVHPHSIVGPRRDLVCHHQ